MSTPKKPNKEVLTKTIVMSYDNFESAIITFLYSLDAIPEDWDVLYTDIGVPLNEDGFVEFDIEIVKPVASNTKKRLRVVDENFEASEKQLSLQLEAFDKINVIDP